MLKNYMEEAVKDVLDRLIEHPELTRGVTMPCTCDQCRLDVVALALNHLPPKYIVAPRGEIFTRVDLLNQQAEADIIRSLVDAIKIVSKRPRHSCGENQANV
jgi:competence protein ComFB